MTGRKVAYYFIAFFGLIAAINSAMISVAVHTHSGTVIDHPYERGLTYNAVVNTAQEQEERGWKGEAAYQKGVLSFTLRDAAGSLLPLQDATAHFSRPTMQGYDFSLPLTSARTPVSFPQPGVWLIRVDANANGIHYQHAQRLVIP